MSLAKVIEVIAEGKSVEEAMENAVKKTATTVHNIKSIYVENVSGIVEKNRIVKYRLNAKLTFILDED